MSQRELWANWKDKLLKKDQLLILVLAGILLLVISLPVGGEKKDRQERNSVTENEKIGVQLTGMQEEKAEQLSSVGRESSVAMEYEKQMEQRLLNLLEVMAGVGEARVMITLKSSQELLLDKEGSASSSETREEDSAGGSRYILQKDNQESTVLLNQDGVNSPICVKTLYPEVEGVVVAAKGAGTGDTSRQISELVQVLFGIDAHRVKIVRLE